MTRRVPVLTGIVILLAGCSAPKETDVAVDIDRILASENVPEAPSPKIPAPPKPGGAIVRTIPSRPGKAIPDPSHATMGSIQANIERQQRDALAKLQKRLQAFYEDKVAEFAASLKQGVDAKKQAAVDAALARIREAFLNYADQRGPKMARFALIVGFPDPNPKSNPPKEDAKPYIKKRYAEAKSIREAVAALDADFNAQAKAILADSAVGLEGLDTEMQKKIDDFRKQVNRQAEMEAQAQVPTSVQELGLQLTEPNPVEVSEIPAVRTEIPAEAPLPPAPKVPSEGIPSGPADRRRLLEHELRIWLALNRYRLAKSARDETESFRLWRDKYHAGP